MIDRGLEPDFPPEALREVEQMSDVSVGHGRAVPNPLAGEPGKGVRDLRKLLWCSIDNDDSRDLDQLTVAEDAGGGATRLLIAIADVDGLVEKGSAVDGHAETNTTSVYTAAKIFPMLPEKLSTDLTSLNEGEDRFAVVIESVVEEGGRVKDETVYRALVHNHAKLAYNAVAAWLEGEGLAPEKLAATKGLDAQLQMQDRAAQAMKLLRHEEGALDLETIEPRAFVVDGQVVDLRQERKNRARELIEDFMIGANGVTARFLEKKGFAAIRRVVRSPERWDRIERVAEELGERLPPDPDSSALEEFLLRRRKADPLRFPDLSLTIVKLMGAGEYVVERAGEDSIGHFGLAVRDYTHSTAPNRRFPDLITQRLLKAAICGEPSPYSDEELERLAAHCTQQEDAANKVERQVRKSAAAQLLTPRIGDRFDAIVTGASAKGTWVRILAPPVEGKLVHGHEGADVGDRLRVKLVGADVERGFIDFVRTGK